MSSCGSWACGTGQLVGALQGLPARENVSRKALNTFGRELTTAESRLTFRERAVKEALQKVGDALKQNLAAAVAARSHEYGRVVLDGALNELRKLLQNLKEWRNAVTRLRDQAENEVRRNRSHLTGKIANLKEFNGTILFDDNQHRSFYNSFDVAGAIRFIQDKLLNSDQEADALSVPHAARAFYELSAPRGTGMALSHQCGSRRGPQYRGQVAGRIPGLGGTPAPTRRELSKVPAICRHGPGPKADWGRTRGRIVQVLANHGGQCRRDAG